MVARGNLVAGLRRAELHQLDETLTILHTPPTTQLPSNEDAVQMPNGEARRGESARDLDFGPSHMQSEPLWDWNSDEGFSGENLIAVAESLDFTTPEWLSAVPLGQLGGYLY